MTNVSPAQQAMLDTFQQHMAAELMGDLDTTMATMTDNPHVNHVPVLSGGVGREGCASFIGTTWWANSFRPMSSLFPCHGLSATTNW